MFHELGTDMLSAARRASRRREPMQDPFDRQASARRASRRLIALFACATVALAALAGYGAVLTLHYLHWTRPSLRVDAITVWSTFAAATALVAAIIVTSSLRRVRRLSIGGAALADDIGARPCDRASPLEARFINVVEEIAIAAGIAPPAAFVLEQEHGINACSLGWSESDCVICVTIGALRRLERAPLQGLVAHEIAHIVNGDTGLRIRVFGWMHGLEAIANLGRRLVFPAWRKDGDGKRWLIVLMPVLFAGAALYAAGWLGWALGTLIRAAVAREREMLADASAMQYTRDPLAIAATLAAIGGFPLGSRLVSPRLEAIRHLFIAAMAVPRSSLLRTHPDLAERIRTLDPSWDGTYPPSRLVPLVQVDVETRRPPVAAGRP
jgi:Zn-dependent protease with chaperone function